MSAEKKNFKLLQSHATISHYRWEYSLGIHRVQVIHLVSFLWCAKLTFWPIPFWRFYWFVYPSVHPREFFFSCFSFITEKLPFLWCLRRKSFLIFIFTTIDEAYRKIEMAQMINHIKNKLHIHMYITLYIQLHDKSFTYLFSHVFITIACPFADWWISTNKLIFMHMILLKL